MRRQRTNRVVILLVSVNRALLKAVMHLLVVGDLQPSTKKSVQIIQGLNLALLNQIISLGHKALVNETERIFLVSRVLVDARP